MTSTSESLLPNPLVEARRQNLERLLQIAAHDYELKLDFGKRDLIRREHLVLKGSVEEVVAARFLLLKGRALHLLGHYFSDSREWSEAAHREEDRGRLFFSSLWHALEDARIENGLVNKWPGSTRAFQALLPPNLGGSLLKFVPVAQQLELGIYLIGRKISGAIYRDRIHTVLEEMAEEIMLGAQGLSPEDSFRAMLRIYPAVEPLLRGERHDTRPRSQDSDGRVNRADPEPQPTQPDSPPLKTDAPQVNRTKGQLEAVSMLGKRQEFPEWYFPGSAPWFERGLGIKDVHPTAYRTDRQTIVAPPEGDLETYLYLHKDILREVGFLSHRLTNLLREETYLRFSGYHRTGKLNMAKLWKQRMGNYRLFQRPTASGGRSVAITLLIDESASMKGHEKLKVATKAAIFLGETLELLCIPFEIIGYTTSDFEARSALLLGLTPAHQYRTTRCSPLEHRIYKGFNDSYRTTRMRLTGITPRQNNWDEEHLMFAYRRLQERSERHRMIIVLCDGQPNGDADYLIQTVKRIEDQGGMIIGVGFDSEFISQIYTHFVRVTDFRQMADELLSLLVRTLRPGLVY